MNVSSTGSRASRTNESMATTQKQVEKALELERAALRPLPSERFPQFQEGQRRVNRDGHVEVAKAFYSAPPEYLGRTVWVAVGCASGANLQSASGTNCHPRTQPTRAVQHSGTTYCRRVDLCDGARGRGGEYLLR